jgi:hypothetical protein
VLDDHCYDVFQCGFKDAVGNSYRCRSYGGSDVIGSEQEVYYGINANERYKGPLILRIIDYPSRIKGHFKVKVN